jgi:hypothetical protein
MLQVTGLTATPKQSVKVQLDNGDVVELNFTYRENQRAWFFDILYKDFACYGTKLTNCPNIVRQFQNTLPFGVGCSVKDGYEPWFLNDFESGRVSVFVLDANDVDYVGQEVYGKIW